MYKIASINSNVCLKNNTLLTDKHVLLDVTNDFIKFKIIFKDYFKKFYKLSLDDNMLKYLFLELILFLNENQELSFISEKTQEFMDEFFYSDNRYSDIIINYDDLMETSQIDSLINDILTKTNNYFLLDFIIYKSCLKLVFKRGLFMREIEEDVKLRDGLNLPSRLSTFCIVNLIDTNDSNFHMMLNELLDIAIKLIKSGGNIAIESSIAIMLEHTKLKTKNNSYAFTINVTEEIIQMSKDIIYEFTDLLLVHEVKISDDSYNFIVETVINEKIIIMLYKK